MHDLVPKILFIHNSKFMKRKYIITGIFFDIFKTKWYGQMTCFWHIDTDSSIFQNLMQDSISHQNCIYKDSNLFKYSG